jgi:hypothetical protein
MPPVAAAAAAAHVYRSSRMPLCNDRWFPLLLAYTLRVSDDLWSTALQQQHSALRESAEKDGQSLIFICKCSEGLTRAPPYIFIFNPLNV